MSTVTYTDWAGKAYTLPIGEPHHVRREGACEDICLSRVLAIDCPLVIKILIRTNGEISLWNTLWNLTHDNTYWHFAAGSDDDAKRRRPTEGQLATLERIFLGLAELPGGIGGALGHPVASWAFEGQTPASIAAKHGVKAPIMNR